MRKVKSILVPTDFTTNAEQALLYAVRLAERFGATVHLLHVVTLKGLESGYPGEFPDMTTALSRVDQAAREQLEAGNRTAAEVSVIKSLTRAFNAHDAIIEYATRRSVDLIVIATRGHKGLTKALLGSVTERVVRFAPCPVLVVKAKTGRLSEAEPLRVGRAVFADDFSEASKQAIKEGIEFLAPYSPQIHLVHAVETELPPIYAMAGVESVFQVYPDLEAKLRALLEERAAELAPPTWKRLVEIRQGKPHEAVTDYAREVDADLLVAAAETRIDLSERVLGGTTERIVRHAPCPTLVI